MTMQMTAEFYVEQSLRQFARMTPDEQGLAITKLTAIVQAAADADLVDGIMKTGEVLLRKREAKMEAMTNG